ncbi:hypothetical protein ACFCXK_08885 [Streptomyces sp. NPDC056269]|uniref:hypothetical protein n=1 Tax=Streptomyces sp. NPDC056269 TaxID=3345768 RepID=UPI0035E15817
MRTFLLGLLLGGISAGATDHFTGDPQLTACAGILAAVLTWLSGPTLLFFLPSA